MKMPKIARDLAALIITSRNETDVAKIEVALAEARAEIEAATRDRDAALQTYRDKILDATPAELEKLLAEEGAAKIRLDRADALIAALTSRLGDAREAEAERAREVGYQDALDKMEAARAALAGYPDLYRGIREMLGTIAEAEIAIQKANADLPANAVPLMSPEVEVRNRLWQPEQVVSDTIVEKWCLRGQVTPAREEKEVRANSQRPSQGQDWRGMTYDMRKFRRLEVLEPAGARMDESLASSIVLPGLLLGEGDAWRERSSPRKPAEVLAELAEGEPRLEPRKVARTTKVTFKLVEGA